MAKTRKNNPEENRGQEDKDLPGYPHYPAEDDIMNPQHGFKKVAADDELANSARLSRENVAGKPDSANTVEPEEEEDLGIVSGTEADVTEEDLLLLGDPDTDQDLGDDEQTRNARVDELEEEQELDVPGASTNDEEALGEEDEENNYYSLGGDRHENLEEDSPNNNE